MQWSKRPLILLGNGARGCDMTPLLQIGLPILTSWNAKDMIDNDHPMYFGSPGQYGQRIANKVFYEADQIVAIGNRMAIWNVGYEGPRPDQRLVMVDVDGHEAAKFHHAEWIKQDAVEFIGSLTGTAPITSYMKGSETWQSQCQAWRSQLPFLESPAHDDKDGYGNSYRFMEKLQKYLKPDAIIVTDAGGACCSAWQVLRVKPPQRMITSGGLGEMGCALPMAIGAAFATGKQVVCIVGDGAMMLNLQELATIAHHQLNIKIIVFANDGYGMIKRSQEMAGMAHAGVGSGTGLSFPSFGKVAKSFGIENVLEIPKLFRGGMRGQKPALMQVDLHPDQQFVPKLNPIMVDGKPTSPLFKDMSPLL